MEQIAAPPELYETPATQFSATFVGSRNALELPVRDGRVSLGEAFSVRAPAVSYVTFALLELIALARYPATIAWADARGWLLVLFLLSVLLVGLYSWRATVAARRS